MMNDERPGVVSWIDLIQHLKDLREVVIKDMAKASDDRALWKAQGRLTLVDELMNLPDTFEAYRAVERGLNRVYQ